MGGLGSSLLGLGNVGTTIFTIVDALASPGRFRREGVDNLDLVLERKKETVV